MIYLRNCDARRTAVVPVAPGWARLLHPGVTSRVPAAVIAMPAVQRLLTTERLAVVTEVNRDPEAGELLRRDMAAAIAAAEARALARLVAQQVRQHGALAEPTKRAWVRRQRPDERKRREDEWPPKRVALLRRRWAEGSPAWQIAGELGLSKGAVATKAYTLGLGSRRRARQSRPDTRVAPFAADAA